jgi:hypothetical protein
MARNLDELVKKYFDPIINAATYDDIRKFLRQQDPDEIEQFLNFYGWRRDKDRRVIVEQELARLRAKQASLADAVEMKPGIFGLSVDLKAAWRWISRRVLQR